MIGSLGSLFLAFAFGASLIACAAYAQAIRTSSTRAYRIGRFGFHGAVISFMFACAVMVFLVLTHRFEYNYVYAHSSRNLEPWFLFASAYAGQEGSFMLWTLFTGLIGVFVLGYAQRAGYEAEVMAPWMMIMVCLLVVLISQAPFQTIYAAFPEQNIPANFIPKDGRGLNPTLENVWLTIHPPILFLGFASMAVPFAFAMAGLIKRDYQRWITVALPWALSASMILGFGIMLGGWWAYETLGWGGYWAWDPVENSSLIPWLVCVAMVHTMLVQKRTGSVGATNTQSRIGGLVKTNMVLAVITFSMVLYSTYLTRSGVLGDTSVHSFVAAGDWFELKLRAVVIFFTLLGVVMIIARWADMRRSSLEMRVLSRESALVLGSAVLGACTFVVLAGTSWPLVQEMFGMQKSGFTAEIYNELQLPITLVIVLLNALSLRLKWKNTPRQEFMRQSLSAAGIAAVATVGLVLLGVHDPLFVVLGFAALYSLVVNAQSGWKVLRGNARFVGAYVAHAGIAILVLGVIFSARYSVTQHVRLVKGRPAVVFGDTLTYIEPRRTDLQKTDREKYAHIVTVASGGSVDTVRPITFWSDFNKRESAFLEPGITHTATRDLYLSPKALDQEGGDPVLTLGKEQSASVPFDTAVKIRFVRFDMSRAQAEGLQGGVMAVTTRDSTYQLTSYRALSDGAAQPVQVPGTDITISMVGLNANKDNLAMSTAILQVSSPSHPQPPATPAITLDVSTKPFIYFVWWGVITMVIGFLVSMIRRRRELQSVMPAAQVAVPDTGPVPSPTLQQPVVARSRQS